ncbi:MAG TPA: phospholipase D-like domain-containing protein [Candidatus Saccharimonadales bacterium]
MFKYFRLSSQSPTDLLTSTLYDENTFYDRFNRDLKKCQHEAIIESPFITNRRLSLLLPALEKLKARGVRITINTRDPEEHENEYMRHEAQRAIATLQHMGIHVLFTGNHHRKLAILDRQILYEGSLNILSQNNSCEVMRRIESVKLAWQMARFVKIDKFVR